MERFLSANVLPVLAAAVMIIAAPGCQRGGSTVNHATTLAATTRSTTASEAEKPTPAKRLRRAPTGCAGPAPQLTSFADYGNLAGKAPVWAGFYAAFDAAGQRYRVGRDAPRTAYGWRVKVLWVVSAKLEQPARVQAHEQSTDAALWFEVGEDEAERAPSGVLDPSNPGVPATENGYKEFPSYVYVPRAGCYELEARWDSGGWRLVFGLGR